METELPAYTRGDRGGRLWELTAEWLRNLALPCALGPCTLPPRGREGPPHELR